MEDVYDILHLSSSKAEIREIIETLKRDLADNSLRESLNVDGFPLTFGQYEAITSNFVNEMDWRRVMLLFKIGLFVRVEEREDVVRDISEKYCDWIRRHGGLGRLVSRSFWARRLGRTR